MKIPNFTAEASLYDIHAPYRTAVALNTVNGIIPAQLGFAPLRVIDPCSAACKCCGRSGNAWCCDACGICE